MATPVRAGIGPRIPREATRVLILHNPLAGRGARDESIGRLRAALQCRQLETHLVGTPSELGAAIGDGQAASSLRAVIAAGGDGTAELVANHTPPGVPIGVFPLGTENLLAKYLKLTAEGDDLANAIQGGRTIWLDAARVRAGDGTSRLFLLMMGCGFDAQVIHRMHEQRRGNISHLSYLKPIWHTIRRYQYPELRVSCYDSSSAAPLQSWTAHWAFVFNTPVYAVGLAICPQADPQDGLLDVVTFQGGSLWQGLKHFTSVLRRCHHKSRSVQVARARFIRIESLGGTVPIQIDGDPGGSLPVEIEVQPRRLRLIVPEDWEAGAVSGIG
jgi:diacylglycerol kinase family enzyme